MQNRFFSIVIPVYNEEESLNELYANLTKSLKSLKKSYEILFIDDGSADNTLERLKQIEKKDRSVQVFSFRKNLGKSYALMLGFNKASGDYIVTLDADLQDDPKNIGVIYQKLIKGSYDVVTGWRYNRQDGLLKKISSKISNKILTFLFKIKLHDLNSGMKIYKTDVARSLKLHGEMHRFIPLIAHESGYKVGEKEVTHHRRKYGLSKYKYTKVITDIPDVFTLYFLSKYTGKPLYFFGKIGGSIFMLGAVILIYLSVLHFIGQPIGRRPLLTFGVLFIISGIQIIFTGLLADLIININSKNDVEFPVKYESSTKQA